MNRRTFFTSAAVIGVVAGAGAVAMSSGVLSGQADGGPETTSVPRPELTTGTVERGDLSAPREFTATISYGEPWSITTTATGMVTRPRAVGTVVDFGDELAYVDERPLFLGRSTVPMYRELFRVRSGTRDQYGNRLDEMSGADVIALQMFLLDAGIDLDGELEVDGIFGSVTEKAVKAWQESVGLPVSGRVDSGQLVFHPDPVRIASELRVGAAFDGIEVTDADATVLVDTSNRDRSALPIGIEVSIALPDGTEVTGEVVKQTQHTLDDGSRVWRSTISLGVEPAGDTSAARVTVVEVLAEDVLHVPVGALLALAEGGFAVEVVTGGTTELVAVDVGEVLEGRAEVTGDLEVGVQVRVPT